MYDNSNYATNSNVSDYDSSDFEIDEILIINDLEAGTLYEEGYTEQDVDTTSLLLFHIYFMGVISGLLLMSIMFKRVR